EEVKLTDKPLSFGYSVVESHSSCRPVKAKYRQHTLTGCMKRRNIPISRFLSGRASWTVIHPDAL
ncbi:hypothetical protein OV659_24520, partial [Salmonella enterica subsp. enterica serovar 1,4,[5],12:i:-]|nr:hypothetical protein [Salmonella enterica subsp. enterica serovar 1,4,[5],12:i:-]